MPRYQENDKYACRGCHFSTNSKGHWDRHIITQKHLKYKDSDQTYQPMVYKCNICQFSHRNKYNYKEHMKTQKHLMKSQDLVWRPENWTENPHLSLISFIVHQYPMRKLTHDFLEHIFAQFNQPFVVANVWPMILVNIGRNDLPGVLERFNLTIKKPLGSLEQQLQELEQANQIKKEGEGSAGSDGGDTKTSNTPIKINALVRQQMIFILKRFYQDLKMLYRMGHTHHNRRSIRNLLITLRQTGVPQLKNSIPDLDHLETYFQKLAENQVDLSLGLNFALTYLNQHGLQCLWLLIEDEKVSVSPQLGQLVQDWLEQTEEKPELLNYVPRVKEIRESLGGLKS